MSHRIEMRAAFTPGAEVQCKLCGLKFPLNMHHVCMAADRLARAEAKLARITELVNEHELHYGDRTTIAIRKILDDPA